MQWIVGGERDLAAAAAPRSASPPGRELSLTGHTFVVFGRTLFTYAVASARGLSGPGLPEVFTLDSSTIIK